MRRWIRQIRGRLGRVRPEPTVVEVAASPPEPAQVAPEVASLEALQHKYEMELAAHRDTTTALLAEKDRTIVKLEELVAELRRQVEHCQERYGEGDLNDMP